jgi:hypothetical protein
MRSNPNEVKKFVSCSRHVVILHYTKNYETKVVYFPKSITLHHCMALLQVALVSNLPHKFVRPPFWCYRSKEIKKYDFRVDPNGIMFIQSFIQIRPAVLDLNHADRQTGQPYMVSLRAHVQRMHNNEQAALSTTSV